MEEVTRSNRNLERLQGVEVGDILVVRSLDEMEQEFGHRWKERIQNRWASPDMDDFCGKGYTVDEKTLNNINMNDDTVIRDSNWNFSSDMLKLKNPKTQETLKEEVKIKNPHLFTPSIRQEAKDPNIIRKMISKVNMSTLTKLMAIAGSDHETKKMANKEIINKYLQRWAEAKYEYFLMFDENLSIEKEIEFEIDRTEMRAMIESLSYQFPQYAATFEQFNTNEYIENKTDGNSFFEKYAGKKYQKGIKVSKFLSQLFEDEKFDIELSKVFQNKKVKGKVVISIDPYDYLTASLNKHGWISCHNIRDGGTATGSFSYMCDDTTLIAYRDNGKIYDYNVLGFRFNGNSKSWRQCIYFDKDTCSIIFGREYPNYSKDMAKEIRLFVEDHVANYLGKESKWTMVSNNIHGKYNDVSTMHYPDVDRGYDYKFARFKNLASPEEIKFNVGSNVDCVYCGKELDCQDSEIHCGCLHKKEEEKQHVTDSIAFNNGSGIVSVDYASIQPIMAGSDTQQIGNLVSLQTHPLLARTVHIPNGSIVNLSSRIVGDTLTS